MLEQRATWEFPTDALDWITDLPGGDTATLLRSIREQILPLPGSTILHAGHGPDTTVEREALTNPFLTGAIDLAD
jgi:glyoxylase-like metal-dependent hydrolase (beta-lactamase superfamily II)